MDEDWLKECVRSVADVTRSRRLHDSGHFVYTIAHYLADASFSPAPTDFAPAHAG